jgi:hypothetical protein
MRATLEAHLGSQQVARVVYGSIIGLALVVALGAHPPGPVVMVGLQLGTAVAVGLAEVYSEVVGAETSQRHLVTRKQVGRMLQEAGAVAFGIAFPAVFFLLAALGLYQTQTAFSLAKWTGLGLIFFYAYWAARFAGSPRLRALVRAVLVTLIGAGLIVLKSLLH